MQMVQKKLKSKPKVKAFKNWRHNAIHLTFPNGNGISVVWGAGSYSDNHDTWECNDFQNFMESDTVEIMILNAPDKLYKEIRKKYEFEDDNVKGWVSITEWLEILNLLAKD